MSLSRRKIVEENTAFIFSGEDGEEGRVGLERDRPTLPLPSDPDGCCWSVLQIDVGVRCFILPERRKGGDLRQEL